MRTVLVAFFCILVFAPFNTTCLAQALERVSLQLQWYHQFQFAGYYMAKEKGFYQDVGLEVDIRNAGPGINSIDEVLSGQADFGIAGSGLLTEYSLGKPVVAVAAIFQESPTVFLSLKESGIERPEDLAGKKVMLSPGFGSQAILALLYHYKLLDKIERIDTTFDHHSLINAQTDVFNGYLTNEPYLLESQGYDVNIIAPRDYGINFYGDTIFTTRQMVGARPHVVENFRQATIKGWQYALDHVEETIWLIKEKYDCPKTEEQLRFEAAEVAKVIQANLVPIGTMGLSRWAQITHHLIAIGAISPSFSISEDFIYTPPQRIQWIKLLPYIFGIAVTLSVLLFLLAAQFRTNRKLQIAQKKISASERKYRCVINHQRDILLLHKLISDGYATYSDVNEAAVAFLGYSREELLAMSPHEIVDPEFMNSVGLGEIKQRLLAEGGLTFESIHVLKSGERVPVEVSATIIEIEGEPYILSMIRDMRGRKQAEAALKESEQKFRLLANYTTDWEYWIDQQSRFLYISPSCEAITGYTQEEFIKDPLLLSKIIQEGQDENIQRHFTKEGQEGSSLFTAEFSITIKNGETRWLEHTCRPIYDDAGQLLGRRGNNRDITQRKQVETKYGVLFKEANIGIAVADAHSGKLLEVNDCLARTVGRSVTELIGKPQSILHSEEVNEKGLSRSFTKYLDDPSIKIINAQLVTESGERLEVEIKAKPLVIDNHEVILGIFNNVTEQRKLENQLRQKHKMEAVGYMAGGMAHNFNNNLSIILGNLELIQLEENPDSKIAAMLENAKIAVLRSRDLIQKIMTYSRKGDYEKSHIKLSDSIRETTTLLKSTLPTTIELKQKINPDCLDQYINADPSQIQEVLINLCNNAVHAMDEKGELSIYLDHVVLEKQDIPAQYEVQPGRFAKLSIQDTGCGIPSELIDKIFDPFFTTKEDFEGAGMGLATVQGIVAQHHGLIKVNSIKEKGTVFDLYFPLVSKESETQKKETAQETKKELRGTEHILFVDDDPMLVRLGKNMLTPMGYTVQVETDSNNALQILTQTPDSLDLLISDQTMPNLTGLELIAKVKKIRPDLPAILLTGFSSKVNEETAEQAGIDAFMMKPIQVTQLLQTVRKVLDSA